MKVLLFLPKGFEHMETGVFIDVFGWARDEFGMDIALETAGFTREVSSTFGVPIVVEKSIDELATNDYDALALPGGFFEYGYFEEAFDERFLNLLRSFNEQGKTIASICVAALPLGKSGILKGRRATTYHLCGSKRLEELAAFGANTVRERLVVDGNIITSCGPETAVWVAFQLIEMLTSPEDAKKVRDAMGYIFTIDRAGRKVG